MTFRQSVKAIMLLVVMTSASSLMAAQTPAAPDGMRKATFAGGCFWCMQPPFEHLEGVSKVTAGYTGGHVKDPSYEQVSAGGTGDAESVEVIFDPEKISYAQLLDVFWHNVDPTQQNGQFCDIGHQYRTAIFTHSEAQMREAKAAKASLQKSDRFAGTKLYTEIVPAKPFYAAETYHQDYARKNPVRYKFYRWNCGRDQRLKQVWGSSPEH